MSESMERAHETMEHGEHADKFSRGVAVLVSVLAAVLAITEVGAKSTQSEYLTHHITLSDDWAFYQAKALRAAMKSSERAMLASLPNAADPAIQQRIKETDDYIQRMRDDPEEGEGMKQLAAKAKEQEVIRDTAEHRYHGYEYAAGGLELAIVLSSVSVVTRVRLLTALAMCIGCLSGLGSLGIALRLF